MRFSGPAGSITAVQDVTFGVADGEVVSLIGPSGCGKSTLLNIGAGLNPATSGLAYVDGGPVEGPNAHVAFMLQKDLMLPWRTIAENVMLGTEIQGASRQDREDKAQVPAY
jgi:NitT/TauT family transport system ATP-binding protein